MMTLFYLLGKSREKSEYEESKNAVLMQITRRSYYSYAKVTSDYLTNREKQSFTLQ